jgi:alpha-L-fucosidase
VFERYVEHLHRQVTELLTKYGDIGIMWFDGEWESTWTHELGIDLYDHVRSVSPARSSTTAWTRGVRACGG